MSKRENKYNHQLKVKIVDNVGKPVMGCAKDVLENALALVIAVREAVNRKPAPYEPPDCSNTDGECNYCEICKCGEHY